MYKIEHKVAPKTLLGKLLLIIRHFLFIRKGSVDFWIRSNKLYHVCFIKDNLLIHLYKDGRLII